MIFRGGLHLTRCGFADCGKEVTASDKSSKNFWFMDFSELNHNPKLCAAKLKKEGNGEICADCAANVPKLQIMHHECPPNRWKSHRE